jgi:hypothetical protein
MPVFPVVHLCRCQRESIQRTATLHTSEPQRPVATTLTRTCLAVGRLGMGPSLYENCLVGLRTKEVLIGNVKDCSWAWESLESHTSAEDMIVKQNSRLQLLPWCHHVDLTISPAKHGYPRATTTAIRFRRLMQAANLPKFTSRSRQLGRFLPSTGSAAHGTTACDWSEQQHRSSTTLINFPNATLANADQIYSLQGQP